ncbi:cobyric acid synthase [Thalassotalea sp. PLHSN55]|uniref:cobyric acid synthase n=1 Tax=Thalassotalea sp. PLHSN55 TaxID=3435888 RepID=UPI003F87768C
MKTLMVQGTTSDAGKSTLVAGLCRVFVNLGYKVAPFKPQNMALNSAVTSDGGEIGRAQALQAIAAKTPLRVDFNPILLKPNSDTGAQVIVHGKAISNMEADSYHDYKKVAMDAVLTSHQRLANDFNVLMVEGAGSPAEINLRANDIANMGYAEAVDCPVILVADIDKGGVFAHLVGTLALLSESEQARVKGFVINRFRGDIKLLESGLDWLEEKTGKPVLGVLPYLHDLALDAEDAIAIDNKLTTESDARIINIAVPLLPHISNHTDFDALRLHQHINLTYVRVGERIPDCDLIILPGSKNVIEDLAFVKAQGWQEQIQRHLRYGGKVLGICGGYQMLGNKIFDPLGIESSSTQAKVGVDGLGFLDITTVLSADKTLTKAHATMTVAGKSCQVKGYEIHCGRSSGAALASPLLSELQLSVDTACDADNLTTDGVVSQDGQIIGTYLHGLFDSREATELILHWVDKDNGITEHIDLDEHREIQLERLASVCQQYLDIEKITEVIQQGTLNKSLLKKAPI